MVISHVAMAGYPNVKTYASAPGLRNVISSVRSRTASAMNELVEPPIPEQAVTALVYIHAV